MFGGKWTGKIAALVGALMLLPTIPVRANVDIEWRPAVVAATPGNVVEIQLFIVSDSGFDQSFSGASVLFGWDPAQLELLGFVEPCTQKPCAPGTYDWLQSWFPDDSGLEGINDSLTDGDAFFQVLGRLGADELPFATAAGLQVTTLRFRVTAFGTTQVAFIPEIGVSATRVAGGDLPGLDVTGTLGPPVGVLARACETPGVVATGSRYLSVTPADVLDPVALRVTSPDSDPGVSCVDAYVQSDGSLGATPVYQVAGSWGTVSVAGEAILPSTTYAVQADCAAESPGLLRSVAASGTTWRWGDTNGDNVVTFADVSRVVDAADGGVLPGTMRDAVDLVPCAPDGIVTQDDVSAALAALGVQPFPCLAPCVTTDLSRLPDFVACQAGPDVIRDESCAALDFDSDDDVDLSDFAVFGRRFTGLGN